MKQVAMPRKHLNIGGKIQNRRKAMGLSQEDLAQRTGVSRQAVTKWETGQSAPDLDRLVRICDELGISLDHLLRDDVEVPGVPDAADVMDAPDTPDPASAPAGEACGRGKKDRLPAVCGGLLLGAGLLGLFVMWILARIYPVRLTDWDGSRYTGLWGFVLRYDLGSLFWLALGLAAVGALVLIVCRFYDGPAAKH